MRTMSLLLTVAFLGAMSADLYADGLIRKLPKDGSWVEYHATLTGGSTNISGKLVLKSVGTTVEKDEPHRWIEVELIPADANDTATLYKFLVPEKSLKAGIDPLRFVLRAWEQNGQERPQQLEDPNTLNASLLGAMLHGPLDEEKPLGEEQKFPYQNGTLTSVGKKGTRKVDLENIKGILTSTTWEHEDVPFGVAGLLVHFGQQESPDAIVIHLVVSDFGGGTKSKLPDAN